MDLRAVANHYCDQFEKDGWKEQGRGMDDMAGWSEWSTQDDIGEPVDAVFVAVRHPGTSAYFLLARAARPEAT